MESPGNFPLRVDVGALPVRIASLKAIPAAAIRIGVHRAGVCGEATTPASQHKPRARKFPG